MTAKLHLDIDAAKAFETIRKLQEAGKNITIGVSTRGGGGRGGGGGKSAYAENESEHTKYLARIKKGHVAWVKELRKYESDFAKLQKEEKDKDVAYHKKTRELKLKEEQKYLSKAKKGHEEWVKELRDEAKKEQKIKEKAHKEALAYVKMGRKEEARLYKEYIKDKERQDKEYSKKKKQELKDQQKAEKEYQRTWNQRANYASGWGRSIISGPLQGGLSRLGGVFPDSTAGLVTRNMVTGTFIGGGIGAGVGNMVAGGARLAGGLISKIPSLGKWGGPVGAGVSALGGMVASPILQVAAMTKGAAIAGTATIMYEGFSKAVGLFSSVVGTFASAVASLLRKGAALGTGIAGTAFAGLAGVTAAGVSAYSERMGGEAGLDVVVGPNANLLRAFAASLSSRQGSLYRYSNLVEASTKASSFGMSPGLIMKFMPKMMQAGSVMGESDIAFGMRALVRAATQAEPEAAERFGLNLYEKNLKQLFGNKYNLNDPAQKAEATYAAAEIQLRKFEGGEARIRNTPGGAFQYLGNRWTQLKESIGQGFSEGFQLIPRLNDYGNFIGSDSTRGRARGFFQGVGQMAGKGADWLMKMVPKALTGAKEFISSQDEGTSASQWGESFKGFIKSAIDGFKTLINMIKIAWTMLNGKDGIFEQAKKKWDEFIGSFSGKGFGDIFDMIVGQISGIADYIQSSLEKAIHMAIKNGIELGIKEIPAVIKDIGEGAGKEWAVNSLKSGGNPVLAALGMMGLNPFEMGMQMAGGQPKKYAKGGVVPGGEGNPQLAVVHGGEMILNRKQQSDLLGNLPHYANGTVGQNTASGAAIQWAGSKLKPYAQMAWGMGGAMYGAASRMGGSFQSPSFGIQSPFFMNRNNVDMNAYWAEQKRKEDSLYDVARQRDRDRRARANQTYSPILIEAGNIWGRVNETSSPSGINPEYAHFMGMQSWANYINNRDGDDGSHVIKRNRNIRRGRNTRNVTVHGNMYIRGDANDRMRYAEALG